MNDNDTLHLGNHSKSTLTLHVSLETTNSHLTFRRHRFTDEEMNLQQEECSSKDTEVVTRRAETMSLTVIQNQSASLGE